MDIEFVTPLVAINRLWKMHYSGRKRGSLRRVRMALIGALRSGQVEWHCQQWLEKYWTEDQAEYDENGGWTANGPKDAWPADFWQPALAADDVCWEANCFNTFGSVSLRTAPSKVRRWLQQNNEANANWQRVADKVEINWTDASELLKGTGWQAWISTTCDAKPSPLAAHYRNALIRMIARVGRDASILGNRKRLNDVLFEEFEFGGKTPDESELREIARLIWVACQPVDDSPPPSN